MRRTPVARSCRSRTRSPSSRSRRSPPSARPSCWHSCGTGLSALSPVALLRATLVAAEGLDAVVVAVPLPSHGDAETDHRLGVQVTATYAAGDPVHGLRAGGEPDEAVGAIVERDRPAPDEQGLVLFFTGLSGSGKSTLARALMDRLLEAGLAQRHQPRRRRRAPPPLGRADLLQGRPGDQHPSDRLGGRGDLPPRRRRGLQPDRPVRRDPPAGARDGRRGPRRVLPRPRGHAAGGVRAPRPQGPLRQGPPRRDPRVHRHLLALRGARGRRRPRRHHRPHHRRRPRRRPRRPRRRRPHPPPAGGRGASAAPGGRGASEARVTRPSDHPGGRGAERTRRHETSNPSTSSSSAPPTSAAPPTWSSAPASSPATPPSPSPAPAPTASTSTRWTPRWPPR